MSAKLRITLTKSPIGYERTQKETVRSLGFKKMNQTVEHDDNPVVRGMIHKVRHLVSFEAFTSEGAEETA